MSVVDAADHARPRPRVELEPALPSPDRAQARCLLGRRQVAEAEALIVGPFNRVWKPAQKAAGITPLRRVYDLRHTFATFALRAGISTFDLSRYMGTSLAMIDRHYGHLARDGREHAIKLLDTHRAAEALDVHAVDARWTPNKPTDLNSERKRRLSRKEAEAL